ncbi:hypothetical protein D9758_015197 [Tetrapyrgos nigripes]|uniref:CCHC-type domain-containing protein n=1 Tax=Tetrapyrgos nigripes TaxID=182062 RepID=A0A8H5FNB3_9AGAR|nr:hypothetical protein D9758_015197 [Tetrapyrgos nigripes]
MNTGTDDSSLATITRFGLSDSSDSDASAHTATQSPIATLDDSSTLLPFPSGISPELEPHELSSDMDDHIAQLEQASQEHAAKLDRLLSIFENPPPPNTAQPPPTTVNDDPEPSSHHSSSLSHAKASPPSIFDGLRSNGHVWWTSVVIYASTVHFTIDQAKIMWALSYFASGRAAVYRQVILDHDTLFGKPRFVNWAEFEADFTKEFLPEDDHVQASLVLEGTSYFQGNSLVDDYIDTFRSYVTLAGLNVEPVLYAPNPLDPVIAGHLPDARNVGQTVVLKFHQGLKPSVERKVAEAESRPLEWDIMGWYNSQHFDKHEREDAAFRTAQGGSRTAFPSKASAPVPIPASAPSVQQPAPLPPGVPMEVDTTWGKVLAKHLCYNCGRAGHLSFVCPDRRRQDVCTVELDVNDWAEIAEAYAAYQDMQALEAKASSEEAVSQEGFGSNHE